MLSAVAEEDDQRRQSMEPFALDTTRLRPSLLIRDNRGESNSAEVETTMDSTPQRREILPHGRRSSNIDHDNQEELQPEHRVSEPTVLATMGTSSPRNSVCMDSVTSGTLSSSFETSHASSTSRGELRILAKELDEEDAAAKRGCSIRVNSERSHVSNTSTRINSERSRTSSTSPHEVVVLGLSRGVPTSKFPSHQNNQDQVSLPQSLASLPLDLPLPQPLPEPTPATLSQPGAYPNGNVRGLDLEAPAEWNDEEPTTLPANEATIPPPLVEATLVVPGNTEETASNIAYHNFDSTRSSTEIQAVEAEQAGLADLLQNRKLRCFMCSLVFCVLIFATTTLLAIMPYAFDSQDEGGMMTEPSGVEGSFSTTNSTTKDKGLNFSEVVDDDVWTDISDGDAIVHNDDNGFDDGPPFNLSATRTEFFRQYLVFDREPQWNESLRNFSQETIMAYTQEAIQQALNELPVPESKLLDVERLQSWVRKSLLDIECLIVNISTSPLPQFRLDNQLQRRLSSQQRLLPNWQSDFSTFNQTITSSDLWESDVLFVLKWPWNEAMYGFPVRSEFPRFIEEHTERFTADFQATWGDGLQSVSPPVFLDVTPDEDSEDYIYQEESPESAVVGRYRQRFVIPTSLQHGGYFSNTALFESMMEIYSLNLLRDIIPSYPEYKGLNTDEIETECELHVTSSSGFPSQEPYLSDSLQVHFVYYSIWWISPDWSQHRVNASTMDAFPTLFLEQINDQPTVLTENFVNAGLMLLQSRPAKFVEPV